ncbi:hypothetical protein DPMN_162083 [Dreissena polymorpha]|uniref:Uncharacterized protein n=1 Tax=Dreissena polymorpha TaxID=45954 RepID=A0A9D4ITB7_DREPO|nr:hypothetical protein DPMN_162083 [Dreissena polymorpha]
MKREYYDVQIPELCKARIVVELPGILDPRDKPYSPLQVWNLKYEQVYTRIDNYLNKASLTKWC